MTQVTQILTQPILSLDLELPSECSATALRDGIVSLSGSEIGEKAGWLLQMLGQVPPDFWTHRPRTLAVGDMLGGTGGSPAPENSPNAPVLDGFNIRPQELLQVAASSQWYGIWLEGMAIAAQRHQHLEWAEALLAVLPTFPGNGYNLSELSPNLMEILPIERRESLVWQILQTDRGDRLKKNHPLLFLLRLCRHCWSPDLSLAVLNRMAIDISTSQDNYNWGVRSTIRDFAYFIHPAILSDAQRLLKNAVKPESYWAQTVEEFLEILQFRHDMLLAIEYSQSANAS